MQIKKEGKVSKATLVLRLFIDSHSKRKYAEYSKDVDLSNLISTHFAGIWGMLLIFDFRNQDDRDE